MQKKQKGQCVWGTSWRFVLAGGWDAWAQMPFSQADPQPVSLPQAMPQFVPTSVCAGHPCHGVGGPLWTGVHSLAWALILEISWVIPTLVPTALSPHTIVVVSFP